MSPLETERLLLRPWRPEEAAVQRQLWTERDPRVPPHRRIDADGRPSVSELEASIRADRVWSAGLLAVERRAEGDVIGYCGLVETGRGAAAEPTANPHGIATGIPTGVPTGISAGIPTEPELAFELLHRVWGRGYATEAAQAVLDHAHSLGHRRLWATVWDWNTASRRVLAKVGFTETDRVEVDPGRGTTLWMVLGEGP